MGLIEMVTLKTIEWYCAETNKTWQFKRYGNIAFISEFEGGD